MIEHGYDTSTIRHNTVWGHGLNIAYVRLAWAAAPLQFKWTGYARDTGLGLSGVQPIYMCWAGFSIAGLPPTGYAMWAKGSSKPKRVSPYSLMITLFLFQFMMLFSQNSVYALGWLDLDQMPYHSIPTLRCHFQSNILIEDTCVLERQGFMQLPVSLIYSKYGCSA